MKTEDALEIVEKIIDPHRLNDVQALVFCQSWCGKSYQQIALESGYDSDYIKDVGSKLWQLLSKQFGERVTKHNLHSILRHYTERGEGGDSGGNGLAYGVTEPKLCSTHPPLSPHSRQDCTEAIAISQFYGRQQELATVERWILQEECALVAILGMGGIGKTAFSVQLVQQISPQFDRVIWRNLRYAPPLRETLAKLIRFISNSPETPLLRSDRQGVEKLLQSFQQHRCLVIFDNFESLFEPLAFSANLSHGFPLGSYRKGYEGYDEILRQVGELLHPSCAIVTSREKPETIATLEGNTLRVRVLELKGLDETAAQKLLEDKGLKGRPDRATELVRCYHGNPLALKRAATAILELYNGKLSDFLAEKNRLLPGIQSLLEEQFQRLSILEEKVMYWLAIARKPVSVTDLLEEIVPPESKPRVMEALEFLRRRSLIEKTPTGFTQSALIGEYVTERLIEGIYQELVAFNSAHRWLINQYPLIQVDAEEPIETAQIQTILEPLVARLKATYTSQEDLAEQLNLVLVKLRSEMLPPGYAAGNLLNLLTKLKIDLTGADFSDLTVWQADLSEVPLHGVNFSGSNLAKSVFSTRLGDVVAIALNREGSLLATGEKKGIICLWHVKDRQPLRQWKAHEKAIASLGFSGNGNWLASRGLDRQIKVWEVSTGNCRQSWPELSGIASSVAFSRDDRIVAIAQQNRILGCWDVCTGETLYPGSISPNRLLFSLAFTGDRQAIALQNPDLAKVLESREREMGKSLDLSPDTVWAIAFDRGGCLCVGSAEGTISLWHLQDSPCIEGGASKLESEGQQGRDRPGNASNDSPHWAETGGAIASWQGHRGSVSCVAWNADGTLLASSGSDRTLKVWQVATQQCVKSIAGYDDGWESLAVSPDGKWLASGSAIAQIALWNLRTGECEKVLQGHSARVCALAFSADGQLLASSSEDAAIHIWSVGEFQPAIALPGVEYGLRSLAFSPTHNRFACPHRDRTLRIWDVRHTQCWKILPGDGHRIFAVAWSPDGAIVASASDAPAITLWNVETGECLHTLHGHRRAIVNLAFSPDGTLLASASGERTLRIWNVRTGQCFNAFPRDETAISTVAFSPQGTLLASGSADGSLTFCNLTRGMRSFAIQAHTEAITALTFTPDGQTPISASRDATIQCWHLDPTQEIPTPIRTMRLRMPRLYENMNVAGVSGLSETVLTTLKLLGAKE